MGNGGKWGAVGVVRQPIYLLKVIHKPTCKQNRKELTQTKHKQTNKQTDGQTERVSAKTPPAIA